MKNFAFRTESSEVLLPDTEKAYDIFARLGYKIPDAIADLVDNSVDAEAANVHIRFGRTAAGIHSVVIADDGRGMSEAELREAMRFGSRIPRSGRQLGKYGIGLKSASLSQARTVTVLTRQGRTTNGRRWTEEKAKAGWNCEILKASDVRTAFASPIGAVETAKSGTIIIWERLTHLQTLPANVDTVLARATAELQIELGIRFHRFLEKQLLTIGVDQQYGPEEPTGVCVHVTPLNPFGYEHSGHPDYPARLRFNLEETAVVAECHIWPPQSHALGYRLGGGKVALRQGFYFYRNNRVIQAGGWNGVRGDDGEPHLSLARVKIDLPSELDSMFKLDVTKSRLDPSPQFISTLRGVTVSNGITFDRYLSSAEAAYRRQKKKEAAKFARVPGSGFSKKAQKAIATILAEPGAGRPKKVAFKWALIDPDEIVRVDAENDVLFLNSRYRPDLSEGNRNDAPVLKLALLLLLQKELDKSFATAKSIEWLQRVNQALLASMKA